MFLASNYLQISFVRTLSFAPLSYSDQCSPSLSLEYWGLHSLALSVRSLKLDDTRRRVSDAD